jgi:hypothetical protein
MVNVTPAIVRVPVRTLVPVLAVTLYETVPDPVPFAPLVTVIQAWWLVAVQEQLEPVTTLTTPVVPVNGTDTLVADRLKLQLLAACVTV